MNTKNIIILITVVSLAIAAVIIYKNYFYSLPSLSSILEKSDFAETIPPNKLISPGAIALVEGGAPHILKIICPGASAFGDAIAEYYIESPSTAIDLSSKLEGKFNLDLSFANSYSLSPKTNMIREITLKLSNVKLLELPDDAVFKNIKHRSPYCSQAINNRLNRGEKITLIKRVIQADAEYTVSFADDVSQGDTLNLMKYLALELTGSSIIKNRNTIVGKDLYWGVDDDVALAKINPGELPATGSGNRPRLTQKEQSYKVELVKESYNVTPIKQPSDMSCWIATYTMMLSWKEDENYSIDEVIDSLGEPWRTYYSNDGGLPPNKIRDFLLETNLSFEMPANYTLASYEEWLKNTGPVWIISGDGFSSHAKLLVGLFSDNNGDVSIFEFIDPATGKIQRMEMLEFIAEYEREARFLNDVASDLPFRIQIIHF